MANHQKFFIGVDEAGYGPNLGPLVIAATVWKSPKSLSESELCEIFAKFSAPRQWKSGCEHLPLGDSKQLYQPASGLASLETGLLAILSDHGREAVNLANFIRLTGRIEHNSQFIPAWYTGLDQFGIPWQADVSEIDRLAQMAKAVLATAGIEFVAAKSLVISESSFNQAVEQLGTKGLLLSRQTLGLVAELWAEFELDAEIYCDRQGGRKNYLSVLLDAMPEEWFEELAINNRRCSYRNRGPRSLEIHFTVAGDQFPPTALASMLAKYLREYLVHSLNLFWKEQLPHIKPTAGYPVDANRFRAEIASTAARLQIDESQWWRCR